MGGGGGGSVYPVNVTCSPLYSSLVTLSCSWEKFYNGVGTMGSPGTGAPLYFLLEVCLASVEIIVARGERTINNT